MKTKNVKKETMQEDICKLQKETKQLQWRLGKRVDTIICYIQLLKHINSYYILVTSSLANEYFFVFC